MIVSFSGPGTPRLLPVTGLMAFITNKRIYPAE